MRFDPFGWFAVRRLREARAESKAMAEDWRRNEGAPMSPERRERLMEFRAQIPTTDGPDLPPLTEDGDERLYTIVVFASGLSDHAIDELFSRIADAAHACDEQVACSGGYDIDVARRPR